METWEGVKRGEKTCCLNEKKNQKKMIVTEDVKAILSNEKRLCTKSCQYGNIRILFMDTIVFLTDVEPHRSKK